MNKNIVLLSEDGLFFESVQNALKPLGYEVSFRAKLTAGLKNIKGDELIILDLQHSISAIKEIKAYHPEAMIIMTGDGQSVQKAINAGVYDCIERHADPSKIVLSVRNAFRYMTMLKEYQVSPDNIIADPVIGRSPNMQKIMRQVQRTAVKNVPVLISGEKGTGRATVARMMHSLSQRRTGPFVTLAPLPDIEKTLFGDQRQLGAVHKAEMGTLFLENIGAYNPEVSSRISSLIRKRGVSSLQDDGLAGFDIRVICSANGIDRANPVFKGFAVEIKLPPLRDRKEDIATLAEGFLQEAAIRYKLKKPILSKAACESIANYEWPGNVSELKRTMERACLISRESEIMPLHLGLETGHSDITFKEYLSGKLGKYIKGMAKSGASGIYGTVISEVEKAVIEITLKETSGNQLKASRALGITRVTLRNKIKQYDIDIKLKTPKNQSTSSNP